VWRANRLVSALTFSLAVPVAIAFAFALAILVSVARTAAGT
jgi:hypothetical protein